MDTARKAPESGLSSVVLKSTTLPPALSLACSSACYLLLEYQQGCRDVVIEHLDQQADIGLHGPLYADVVAIVQTEAAGGGAAAVQATCQICCPAVIGLLKGCCWCAGAQPQGEGSREEEPLLTSGVRLS